MLLQACLNGARQPGEHPALPLAAAAAASDAAATVDAGAGAIHVHPKDVRGLDTLDADVVGAFVEQLRVAIPGVPVGVTTGAWASPDSVQRVAAVAGWRVRPDFASVNWHETGAEEVATALLRLGVGIEAGLWHADAVQAWLTSPLRTQTLRVLIELPDGLDESATHAQARRLLALVQAGSPGTPILLHGEGSSTCPAFDIAVAHGLDTRIGLEDTLLLPGGEPAPDNATLVRVVAQRLQAHSG